MRALELPADAADNATRASAAEVASSLPGVDEADCVSSLSLPYADLRGLFTSSIISISLPVSVSLLSALSTKAGNGTMSFWPKMVLTWISGVGGRDKAGLDDTEPESS